MNVFKRISSLAITTLVVVALLFTWLRRQDIYDAWSLYNYEPTAEIAALADATTMTDSGRRIFYIAQPLVVDELEFNNACKPESTIVLGCYISGKGIYLHNIEDERLAGVEEVTAAHEMLHAAYERLSDTERAKVDGLTQAAYQTLDNQRIKKNIDQYRNRDPGVVPNELHSIFATEVRDLPSELESYYAQYFTDRSNIVAYSERYESEFQKRRTAVENLDQQLGELKLVIEASQRELSLQYDELKNQKNQLDVLIANGQTARYNSLVPSFNQQVNDYNNAVNEVESQINQYNALVQKRNNIALEVQDLVDSIDSRPQSF